MCYEAACSGMICPTCWEASDLAGELSSISHILSGSVDLQHTLLEERVLPTK